MCQLICQNLTSSWFLVLLPSDNTNSETSATAVSIEDLGEDYTPREDGSTIHTILPPDVSTVINIMAEPPPYEHPSMDPPPYTESDSAPEYSLFTESDSAPEYSL